MTLETGTNLPPALLSPDEARGYLPGGGWLRFVAHGDQWEELHALKAAGFRLLCVLTKASLSEGSADWWASELSDVIDAVQVINEPDALPGSPSSDVMGQEALWGHLDDVCEAFHNSGLPIIGPGLCSGDPNWWNDQLNDLVSAIACHPYAKSPAEAANLLEAYWSRWQRPIWVTEYLDPGASMGLLPEYLAAFSALPFVYVAFNYGGSPAWANGSGGTVPKFVLGFATYAAAHPEVGQPIEDEHAFGDSYNVQMTSTGMLFYSKQANAIEFFSKG